MRNKIIYGVLMLFVFLFFSMIIQDTGSGIVSLLILMPAAVVLFSFFYGSKIGFDYMIPIITMVAFIPMVYGFFNESALVYIIVFGVLSLIANFGGGMFGRWIHSEKRKR